MPPLSLGPPRGAIVLCIALTPALFAQTPLKQVQEAASTWAELRSETTRLNTDWVTEKEILDASISALEIRAELLESERDTLLAQTSQDRRELAEQVAENADTARKLEASSAETVRLATRLMTLQASLPPRLATALELPYRSLGEENITPTERLQHITTILNRSQQFNQSYVLAEEIISPTPGSEPRLLEVLYWGLAQACAFDRASNEAFIGRPTANGWSWQPQNGLAADVAEMIAIYRDQAEPRFHTIPALISD